MIKVVKFCVIIVKRNLIKSKIDLNTEEQCEYGIHVNLGKLLINFIIYGSYDLFNF